MLYLLHSKGLKLQRPRSRSVFGAKSVQSVETGVVEIPNVTGSLL